MITLAELENSMLPLTCEIRGGTPSEVESTEPPKFMLFIYTLRFSVNNAHPKGVSLRWVTWIVVEHRSNVDIPLLRFYKSACRKGVILRG